MALILAVNPRGGHSATLARLARELRGHELVGAESCTVAIASLGRQLPDLVLLPPEEEPGQAELLSRLKAVPGGVRTLTLPQPGDLDTRALAALVLETLTTPAEAAWRDPQGTRREKERGSAHLVAAGATLASWIRARRATWTEAPSRAPSPPRDLAPARSVAAPRDFAPEPARQRLAREPEEAHEPEETVAVALGEGRPLLRWLPRVAALIVVAGIAAAGLSYFSSMRRGPSGILRVASEPAGARVTVDGKFAGTTPLVMDGLAADTHTVVVETPTASIRRTVTIAADQTTALNEFLGDGWLRVFAPFEVEIFEGLRPLRPDNGGRVKLPPGSHKLRFANRQRGYEEVQAVEIKPTETTTVRLVPRTSKQ